MELESLQNYVTKSYKKGTFTPITWVSTPSNKKSRDLGCTVKKVVNGTVRLGINYKNTKFAQNHQPTSEVQKPAWFHHTDIKEIVEHNTSGRKYLQCYTSINHFKVQWLLNDKETDITYLLDNGLINKSDVSHSNDEIGVMNIPVENIIEIGQRR